MLCRKGKALRKVTRIGCLPRRILKLFLEKITNVKINYTNLSINSSNPKPIKICLKESFGCPVLPN